MDSMYVDRIRIKEDENGTPRSAWVAELENFDLEADFGISEDTINNDLCKMGQLLVRYGGVAAEMGANLRRKEEELKLVYARVSGAHRSQAELDGTKLTEKSIDNTVIQSMEYQQAASELHVVRANAIKADHWWRSITKKADLMQALIYRQNAELKKGY